MDVGLQIENEMRLLEQEVKEWASQRVSAGNVARGHHLELVKQHRELLASLNAQKAGLQGSVSSQNKSNMALCEEIARVEKDLARLQEELRVLPAVSKSTAATLAQAQAQITPQQQELDEGLRRMQDKYQKMERHLVIFQGTLGLDFTKLEGGGLRVVYTLVDPAQPEKEFAFIVRVTDDSYDVHSATPSANIAEVQALIRQLNETDSFAWFLQAMRRIFRRSVG